METLTTMEEIRLRNLEAIITKGEQTFVDVANALQEICEKRLYRKDCGTFEEYMRKKWHKSARWAQLLIKSGAAVQSLPQEMRSIVRNESVARAISNVPQEKRAKVVEVATQNGAITAKSIAEAAKSVVSPKKEKVLDDEGAIIPDRLVELWNRRSELRQTMREISEIKCRLEKLLKNDPIWRKVSHIAIERLHQAYSAIDVAQPHTVCTECGGWEEIKPVCPPCDSSRFMSKHQYQISREEDKKIRKNDNLSRLSRPMPRQNI